MVYSYQVIKFQTISFVNGVHWSQSVGDKGILYKSLKDPFSKIIVQSLNGSKKLYHIPKDRTVVVNNDAVHFLGEPYPNSILNTELYQIQFISLIFWKSYARSNQKSIWKYNDPGNNWFRTNNYRNKNKI